MGRKIPAKKHHGVKDPIKQQEKRFLSIKDKINAPPTDPDDQPIPKSLTRLFEYKARLEKRKKEGPQKKQIQHVNRQNFVTVRKPETNRNKAPSKPSYPSSLRNPVAGLKKLPGESGREFMLRVNSAVHSITRQDHHEKQLEKSQNPDLYPEEEDARSERFDYIQRKKLQRKLKNDKIKKNVKRKIEEEGEDEGGEVLPPGGKLSRLQRWTLKKKAKKLKVEDEDESRFEPKYETFKFGEVVHEPPSLHIKPRKAKQLDGAPRPGRRDLLLNKLLNGNQETDKIENNNKITHKTAIPNNKVSFDKTGKRRTLPVGVRMRLEQSQQEAIEAYRKLKVQKISENPSKK